MIGDAKWYTAASENNTTTQESYTQERKSTTTQFTSDGVTRTLSWVGKVGLMYPSDAELKVCKKEKNLEEAFNLK